MNGVQTRFKCKLDVKRCKRFVFPPSSLLPRSNALKTKAIRYFQTDRTLTRIVSPPLDVAPTLLGLLNMSYTQNDFGINLLTEQRPYVYFSADNLIAATDTTHLYIYSPHDRQEFKYKKQGNALQLVTGEDSTFYVMKKYCFSTLQSAEYLVKEHKTVNKATGQ